MLFNPGEHPIGWLPCCPRPNGLSRSSCCGTHSQFGSREGDVENRRLKILSPLRCRWTKTRWKVIKSTTLTNTRPKSAPLSLFLYPPPTPSSTPSSLSSPPPILSNLLQRQGGGEGFKWLYLTKGWGGLAKRLYLIRSHLRRRMQRQKLSSLICDDSSSIGFGYQGQNWVVVVNMCFFVLNLCDDSSSLLLQAQNDYGILVLNMCFNSFDSREKWVVVVIQSGWLWTGASFIDSREREVG